MKTSFHNLQRLLNQTKQGQNYIVLDVDRTMINGTSWYRACLCPNLLLAEKDIGRFKEINEAAYSANARISQEAFRLRTLEMMEPTISSGFIDYLNDKDEWKPYFSVGKETSSLRLYLAGLHISKKIPAFEDAAWYVKYAQRYYGSGLKVLFLSAGYQPFIEGVVQGIVAANGLASISYKVLGSDVGFHNGRGFERLHVNQFEKQNVVEALIKHGANVRFLADDSHENLDLFESVRRAGGTALHIKHVSGQAKSQSWADFRKGITQDKIKASLINGEEQVSLAKEKPILPDLVLSIEMGADKIGIVSLRNHDFSKALDGLLSKVSAEEHKNALRGIFKRMAFQRDEKTLLRGPLYYYWTPTYVFLNEEPVEKRWEASFDAARQGLQILADDTVFSKKLSRDEKLLAFGLMDHLINATISCLHVLECAEIKKGASLVTCPSERVEGASQSLFDMMYGFLMGKDVQAEAKRALDLLPYAAMKQAFSENASFHRGLRELDDTAIIYNAVASLVADREKNGGYDYILSFPYGGMELGFALNAYIKQSGSKLRPAEIIHCHYSSKKEIRGECAKIDYTGAEWMFDFVPAKHHPQLAQMCAGEKKILVYDHNVTSFTTLNKSRAYCAQFGNIVDVSAISVNYDNVCRYLVGNKSEPLCWGWENLLDHRPTQEYVTAFNTWLTSEKSKQIEAMFFDASQVRQAPTVIIPPEKNGFVFKLCRVHNAFDLKTAVRVGVNMIGVHAVYPDRFKYLDQQTRYRPLSEGVWVDKRLPVATLEMDSIRAMQKVLPKGLEQALLFEEPLEPEGMKECGDLYGMRLCDVHIQMQHRTNAAYIQEVKEIVSPKVIATIGLFQDDLVKYFWSMQEALDPEHDFVLLDLSKHQPDLISGFDHDAHDMNKVAILRRAASALCGNRVPVLLADDVSPLMMKRYVEALARNGVRVGGIDMQNNVEHSSNEQVYQWMSGDGKPYQTRVRKSPDKMKLWQGMAYDLATLTKRPVCPEEQRNHMVAKISLPRAQSME